MSTPTEGSVGGQQPSIGVWFRELICCGLKAKVYNLKDGQGGSQELASLYEEIVEMLDKVQLFQRLSNEDRLQVAQSSEKKEFYAGQNVIVQGEMGKDFFIITDGQAEVIREDKRIQLVRGDYFGENSLLSDAPRMATVTAVTALSTLTLSQQSFRKLGLHRKLQFANRRAVGGGKVRAVQTKPPSPKSAEEHQFIKDALQRNDNLKDILDTLDENRVNELINIAWKEEVAPQEEVITVGDLTADYFYVVQSGSFTVSNAVETTDESTPSGSLLKRIKSGMSGSGPVNVEAALAKRLEAGDCFGELALLYVTQRTATVRAYEPSVVWVIDRQNFKRVLMEKSEEKNAEYAKLLDAVEILNVLAQDEKLELANALVEISFSKDDEILRQGEAGNTFYILVDGEVSVTIDGKQVRQLSACSKENRVQYFGERALLDNSSLRTATVQVTSENARALVLDFESFGLLLGPLKDIMQDAAKTVRRPRKKSSFDKSSSDVGLAQRANMPVILFNDLAAVKGGLLGNGGFGSVQLFEHIPTGECYALKSMSKGHIVKVGMQHAVVNERNVLLCCSSPYIVRLFAAYNWPNTLAFLLELLLGGELYATYMKQNFWGREEHARYYISVVVLAFEHLHSMRILYRDLKPENIVLDKSGVPKLVDMGLAKRVVGKTHTTCGTPDYFAPEVITGSGHNHAVDWWALGVMVFELLSGNPPFTAAAPMQIFKNALGGIKRVALPQKCQGEAGNLIKALLKKEPSERLPMRSGGVPNIKKHKWFGSVKYDWAALEQVKMPPPYRPEVKSPKDIGNFNARKEDIPKPVSYVPDGSGWDDDFAT
mmetsp:Transcript_156926/g.273150  ORF Transcript_156926/g.273150 Transcript_156926/m.273150 type:complete len:827 (+) Transcript_156926:195-2675(+)